MTKVILMRHGKTGYNDELYAGITDFPVDKEWLKARGWMESLKKEKIDAIYSSCLSRAYDTAKVVADALGKNVQKVREFNELDYGIFEAMTVEKAKRVFPEVYENRQKDRWNYRLPHGESYSDAADRAMPKLAELVGKHEGETILIVCHGTIMKAMLSVISRKPIDAKLDFGAKAFIKIEGGNVRIERTEGIDGLPIDA